MQPKLFTGLLAAAIVLGAGLVLGAVAFVASRPGQPSTAPVNRVAGPDPYPECAAIRRWLRENTGEPGSLEILSWENRYVYGKDGPDNRAWPGAVVVRVKYRGVNQYGGKSVEATSFIMRDGKVLDTMPH